MSGRPDNEFINEGFFTSDTNDVAVVGGGGGVDVATSHNTYTMRRQSRFDVLDFTQHA